VGDDDYRQCDVGGWGDISQVAAGLYHTAGVKGDQTVVTTGYNGYGQLEVSGWTNITQIAAGCYHTVGVKSDGTAVAASLVIELAKWNLGEVAP
jgi:hypothetical protein